MNGFDVEGLYIPKWFVFRVLPTCLAFAIGTGAVVNHVDGAVEAGLNKAKIELTARENSVLRDIEKQRTFGLAEQPAPKKRAVVLINGIETGDVLPSSTDHLSTDEIHRRFSILQKTVADALIESKYPQLVEIKEGGEIPTLVAKPDIVCSLWHKAKVFFAGVDKVLHAQFFSSDEKTSAVANITSQRTASLIAQNTQKPTQIAGLH